MTDDPIITEQTDLMQYVPKVHFEQIPIKNLVSNQEYQRNLSQHHVQRAAANFDLYQLNPVKVSRRNGINYVFNGQHTIEIVALVSGSRETPVWCMVYDFARKAEELLSAARLDAAQAAIKSPEACTVWRLGPLSAADALILEAAMHSLTAPVRDAEEKYVQLLCGLVRRGSGAVQLTPDACWTAANGILYCRSVLKMQPEAIPAPHQLLKTGVYCLPGGYELEIQQLNYEVFLKNPSFLKKDYTYCADYAKINKNIFVRTRQPGDTFRPAGRHVGKTLKKYLNEAKVPVAERTLMPLLACGSQVLWLWGAGFADGLSPDDGTKQILLIRQSRQSAAPEQEQDHNIGGTDHA